MYKDVISVMDGARTLKEHITSLQKILDKPPIDPQLITYLNASQRVLTLQQQVAIKRKLTSQKLHLNNTEFNELKQLYSYCKQHASTGQPQWVVAALNAGWTPPSKP
ncbi:hypothetical protein [Serratia ureilytica]|uniref:hypothetical protein n=1 Tax=Serratia ureilytica TaxID=300181 RepID=UPI0019D30EDB|nr:hypothetical protein [Serratia ureilytica]MBN5214258.1 hypothetical protein [Serratia ureilytica]